MPMRAQMSLIMGHIEPEHPELFALEFGKIAESEFVFNTLASTNIDQSAPNMVKMYMTIRSWMSLIMDLIGPKLFELSALELKNLPYLTIFTLYHLQILTNQYQTWPQYIPIKSRMSLIMGQMESEHRELSALELKNLPYLTVYTLAYANIDQSVPKLATIYIPIKSRMSLIMGQIESEHPELFALEFGKTAEPNFVYTLATANVDQLVPNMVLMYVTVRS